MPHNTDEKLSALTGFQAKEESLDRILPLTRGYEHVLIILLALLPLVATAYIYFSQDPFLLFVEYGLHEVAISIAILQGGFISYVTWRCYLSSGEPQLRWITLSFIGFTLIYGLHGVFTPLSQDHMALFLLYGPASRLLMAIFLLTGLFNYGRSHHSLPNRTKAGFWLPWIAGFLFLDILVGWVALARHESITSIRIGLEGGALLFNLITIAYIFHRQVHSWMKVIFLVSLAYLAESSFVFILAKPWNHLWWLAHIISATGFTVLSFGVIRAFHTTRAFSLVFSQEEVINQLVTSKGLSEKSEANLRAILDNSPYLTWLKDTESKYITGNKAFAKFLRLEHIQLVSGKTDFDIHPMELAEKYRTDDFEVMSLRQQKIIEELEFDGTDYNYVETFKAPVIDAQGNVIGTVGFAQDITERKKKETELRISSVAFESQEAMIITDPKGVILRVNKAFTDSTGYSAEEAVGQKPSILKSGHHDPEFYRSMWESILRTGAWQGEILDRRKNGEVYPKWLTISAVKDSAGVVTHYVGSHFDITERKNAEEKIKHLAFFDHLTNLPNRRLLLDRLQQALSFSARSKRKGALLFIDLDNFKTLNDTLGHNIGDMLLQQVALRLQSCVREGDTVARLGGDEFVVLLENLSTEALEAAAQAEVIAEKIITTLCHPYELGEHEHQNTPSIGITLFGDQQHASEDLFMQADLAMYQAKKAGRNTLRFFDPKMQESLNARTSIEVELRRALDKHQFHLYYQAKVDSSLRPIGAEALIRWVHPERGMVSPVDFIPLAEETGLILPIGTWVLETACTQLANWTTVAKTAHLTIAVNVSARQFHQPDFTNLVIQVLERTGANPQRLKLELTESMLLSNIEDTITKMNELKAHGVGFSLDDFGTGFSSLSYLSRLPLDELKIDRSFVNDLETNDNAVVICAATISLAHSLKLKVVAEGIETEAQIYVLSLVHRCDYLQGYFFSKPVPIEQFETLLQQFR